MVRLYNDDAATLVVALRLLGDKLDNTDVSELIASCSPQVRERWGNSKSSLKDLADELEQQIKYEDCGIKDLDLIDTIIEILQLPFPTNSLASAIEPLRKALLIPEELEALKEATAPACTKCKRKFYEGEPVTVLIKGKWMEARCTACNPPKIKVCPRCLHRSSLPGTRNFSISGKCKGCGHNFGDDPEKKEEVTATGAFTVGGPVAPSTVMEFIEQDRAIEQNRAVGQAMRVQIDNPFIGGRR